MRLENLKKSILRMDRPEAIELLRKIGVSRHSVVTNPKSPRAKTSKKALDSVMKKAEAKLSVAQIKELLKTLEGTDD